MRATDSVLRSVLRYDPRRADIETAEAAVNRHCEPPMTQTQFDLLVAFTMRFRDEPCN